ncbi:hypothetical protein C8J57DRAFT_306413 [Mycena rebaudengoi]|nr:hypothetical protein C8J57DRAFT_306413 [Mycena rebaudengoi]
MKTRARFPSTVALPLSLVTAVVFPTSFYIPVSTAIFISGPSIQSAADEERLKFGQSVLLPWHNSVKQPQRLRLKITPSFIPLYLLT